MDIYKDSSGTLVFKGSLTVSGIESIHAQLEPLLDERINDTVLDLSSVDEIDLSGIQFLYAIKKSAESEGTFRIRSISARAKESILVAGFDAVLKEGA